MIQELSEEERSHKFITELCSGRQFCAENEKYQEGECEREIKTLTGTHPVLGKAVLNIPHDEWYAMRDKYGPDCWHDRQFIRDVGRLNPHLRGARI